MTYTVVVPGPPRGQGRPRHTRRGITYKDQKSRGYEQNIVALFISKYGAGITPLEGPLEMEVGIYFPIPKSVSNKRRKDMLWQRELPTKKPDCSNVLKACEDALNGIAYRDDAQIVSVLAVKEYSQTPHVEINVRPFGDEP